MRHRANPRFWACYNALPAEVRHLADRCYALLPPGSAPPFVALQEGGAALVRARGAALPGARGRERLRYRLVLDRDARGVRSSYCWSVRRRTIRYSRPGPQSGSPECEARPAAPAAELVRSATEGLHE